MYVKVGAVAGLIAAGRDVLLSPWRRVDTHAPKPVVLKEIRDFSIQRATGDKGELHNNATSTDMSDIAGHQFYSYGVDLLVRIFLERISWTHTCLARHVSREISESAGRPLQIYV